MPEPSEERNTKPRLTKDRILAAAIEVADDVGVHSLTMRRLGEHLDVEAMSIYGHVKNKDEILDGIADLIVGEIGLPPVDTDWRAAMLHRATAAHGVLTEHAWAGAFIDSRTAGPIRMRHYDTVISILRSAGFSIELAARAFSTMDSYIYGFALQQSNLPYDNAEQLAAIGEVLKEQVPVDDFPHLHEMIVEYALNSDFDYDVEFAFGFSLILDGLAEARNA